MTYKPGKTYATAIAFPRHLYRLVLENEELVGQVTRDAMQFLNSRCKKDPGLVLAVTIGLQGLAEEFERGEHTEFTPEVEADIARKNYEIEHPHALERSEAIKPILEALGKDRVMHAAEALYEAQRRLTPTHPDGSVFHKFWDEGCLPETRLHFAWGAAVILDADTKRGATI